MGRRRVPRLRGGEARAPGAGEGPAPDGLVDHGPGEQQLHVVAGGGARPLQDGERGPRVVARPVERGGAEGPFAMEAAAARGVERRGRPGVRPCPARERAVIASPRRASSTADIEVEQGRGLDLGIRPLRLLGGRPRRRRTEPGQPVHIRARALGADLAACRDRARDVAGAIARDQHSQLAQSSLRGRGFRGQRAGSLVAGRVRPSAAGRERDPRPFRPLPAPRSAIGPRWRGRTPSRGPPLRARIPQARARAGAAAPLSSREARRVPPPDPSSGSRR